MHGVLLTFLLYDVVLLNVLYNKVFGKNNLRFLKNVDSAVQQEKTSF